MDFSVHFLIVGTQKGGTTALSHFLSQDARICFCPKKEAHFFDDPSFDENWSYTETNDYYKEHFPNFSGQSLVGEATPSYMFLPGVSRRIHTYNPQMKLIFLLRDPVDRAISHYNMQAARGLENRSLPIALALESFRLKRRLNDLRFQSPIRNQSYLARGFYGRQVAMMLRHFPRTQMLFLTSTSLRRNHDDTLFAVYDFLGLPHPITLPQPKVVFAGQRKGDETSTPLRHLLAPLYFWDQMLLRRLIK